MCFCVPVSAHIFWCVCPAPVANSCVCSMSQGHSSHTVTTLQAHPSIDQCFPPSIHVLKHITEMTASNVPLFPPALKTPYCTVYATGGRVYLGHNEKRKYTGMQYQKSEISTKPKCTFYVVVFYSNISILWSIVTEIIFQSLFHLHLFDGCENWLLCRFDLAYKCPTVRHKVTWTTHNIKDSVNINTSITYHYKEGKSSQCTRAAIIIIFIIDLAIISIYFLCFIEIHPSQFPRTKEDIITMGFLSD